MARPERKNVDYFPHPVKAGKKMAFIKNKYKSDGYAIWYQLLEQLGDADDHFIDLSKESEMMLILGELMTTEDLLRDIIADLIKFDVFDRELWEKKSVLFSPKFTESIEDAYAKRKNNCVTLDGLRENLLDNRGGNSVSGDINTQTKVKKTKEKKTKEVIPTVFLNLARLLQSRVQERRQQKITDETLNKWGNDVRLMVSRDSREMGDIEKLINECHDMPPSPSGFTWANNILSMGKLRQRWNEGKIYIGMTKGSKPQSEGVEY